MKLTLKNIVLKELSYGEKTGYELMNTIEQLTGSRPSPGSIYPLLKKFTEEELIICTEVNRKKICSLTKKGKKLVECLIESKQKRLYKHLELIEEMLILTKQKDKKSLTELVPNLLENPTIFMKLLPQYALFEKQLIKLIAQRNIVIAKKLEKILKEANKKLQKI